MNAPSDTWSLRHDLSLVYLALAFGTDRDLSEEEADVIVERLGAWSQASKETVRETVMEALAIYMEAGAEAEVSRSVRTLAERLSEEERANALADLVHIAEADGVLLSSEQGLITTLAEAWGVRSQGRRLIDQTTATVEDMPAWSLMHDLALLYVVLAHSTDGDLSPAEIEAIVERLAEWSPEMGHNDVRELLRVVLGVYAEQPGEKALRQSLEVVRDGLSEAQRLIVLNDLTFIAHADGAFSGEERHMVESIAQALRVTVRFTADVPSDT